MTAEDILRAIQRRPFMPYVVHTTAGKEFAVSDPESVWQAPEPDEDTIIIHVRNVGVADTVFTGRRTADGGGQ
jgi:hypothetical protein